MSEAAPTGEYFFVSYSRANKEFVLRLIASLGQAGIQIWIDKEGLKPGTRNWEQALRDAIGGARGVLFVASPESRRSNYVQDELSIAEMYKRPLYPIWAMGEQWIDCVPLGLGKVQFVDMRADSFQAGLQELIGSISSAPQPAVSHRQEPAPDFVPRNPYKGLRAFSSGDQADFFGRDAVISSLLGRVKASRFVAVVGPSGSGKSSVVMAGLIPLLQAGALPGSGEWYILPPMVPGVHPLNRLTVALEQALPNKSNTAIREDLDAPSLQGLDLLARNIAKRPQARVVLVIDQFEELFTLTADEAERQQFIGLLTTAVNEPESPLTVILTLRADFYDRPMNYAELLTLIKANTEPIPPMSLTDLYDVIQKPAALPDVQMTFDDGLAAELVFEVREQIGALPLLQFALDQLFQRREGHRLTYTAYREIGGVKGALAKHAEETFASLPSDEHRHLARALFLRLIEPGATEQDTTRRRAALNELDLPDARQRAVIRGVADRFVEARLLTTNESAGVTTIEVSHEALIREWERLGNWLKEARDDVRLQKAISQDAAEWVQRGKKADDDGLYRGTVLINADDWAKRNVPSSSEMAFITASKARQLMLASLEERRKQELLDAATRADRARRLLIIGGVVAAALIIVVAAVSVYTVRQSTVAAQATINDAQEMVTQAGIQAQATIKDAQQMVTEAGRQVAIANATLTPVPMTLTAIVAMVNESQSMVESQRLAALSNSVLNQPAGNAETAALLGIRGLKTTYTGEADGALVAALDRAYTRLLLNGHTDFVQSVAFSPDGRYVLTGSADKTARLWDAVSGQSLRTFSGHTDFVQSVAFSPDGHTIVTGSADQTARLWDVASGRSLLILSGHSATVSSVAFSPDGRTVLTGSADKTARLWDAASGENLRIFSGHTAGVNSVAFSPDGRTILTGSDDDTARLWDVAGGQTLRIFSGHTDFVQSVAFSPDGHTVLTGSSDGTARLWDVAGGQTLRIFSGHTDFVTSVAFSPDGRYVLTGSDDDTARLWDVTSGQALRIFSGHRNAVDSVAFSPDGRSIVTGSADTTARLWDSGIGPNSRILNGHGGTVGGVAFSPDGRTILTGSADNKAQLWDAATGQSVRTFSGHTGSVNSVAFSPDGRYVLTGSTDGTAMLWDAASGQSVRTFSGHTGGVGSVAFSPDGRTVLAGSTDQTAILWDAATGQSVRTFNGHTDTVDSVAFSPDGRTILTGSGDGTARLWDVASGQTLRIFSGHTDFVDSVAFSPDGRTILTGSADKTARLWDIASGKSILTFSGHTDNVNSVAFSPDGRYVLTSSADKTAQIWDAVSGATDGLRTFSGHTDNVTGAVFSPDGRTVVTGSADGTVRLWESDYRDFLADACTRVFRDFTDTERQQSGISDNTPTCPQFAAAGAAGTGSIIPATTTALPITLPALPAIASPTASATLTPSLVPLTSTPPALILSYTPSATDTFGPSLTPTDAPTETPTPTEPPTDSGPTATIVITPLNTLPVVPTLASPTNGPTLSPSPQQP